MLGPLLRVASRSPRRTGATTKELMARLGHASPSAAMVYQHATADRDRLIADRLAEMVAEESERAPVVDIASAVGSFADA